MTRNVWNAAHGRPGEVVTARVSNPLENPRASGKVRPVILVHRDGCRWHVMGLTTKSSYQSGAPRRPVPDPLSVGLTGPGYLWAGHLTGVSVLDIERHLGWVDAALTAAVIDYAGLDSIDASSLLNVPLERVAA